MDQKNKPKGLGDSVANFTHATGLDRVAKEVADRLGKEDCGCKARQEMLNKIFPYKK